MHKKELKNPKLPTKPKYWQGQDAHTKYENTFILIL